MKIKLPEIQTLLDSNPSKPEIFYHFKMDWLNIAITLFLMGEKEEAKELVENSLKELSMEECEELVLESINIRFSHPNIFKYLVPSKIRFLYILYKHKKQEVLAEKLLAMKKDNPQKLINKVSQLNYLPSSILANIVIKSSQLEIILNDKEFNNFFHTFGLNTVKPRLHFTPDLLLQEELIEADDLIPVIIKLENGEVNIHLNIIKEKKSNKTYHFKPSEVVEGLATLDFKNTLKVFSYTDKIKHFFKIADLITSSPNKTLLNIFISYFSDQGELKMSGEKIYQEFMADLSFLPEELKGFNKLVQDLKVQEDKAYFFIYLLRLDKEIPGLIRPFLKANKFFDEFVDAIDSATNQIIG